MTNASSTGAQDNGSVAAFHALAPQQAAALVVIAIGLLALLWLRARWHRGRLNRSYNRAMRNPGIGRQLRGIRESRVMEQASAADGAARAFRKFIGFVVLLLAAWLYIKAHG